MLNREESNFSYSHRVCGALQAIPPRVAGGSLCVKDFYASLLRVIIILHTLIKSPAL